MRFRLIDEVVERGADRLVAVKRVSLAEEYLADHFPGYPVLPGVLMLEAMVQAARELAAAGRAPGSPPLVLGGVKQLRFGSFVRPGGGLLVAVTRRGDGAGEPVEFDGEARLLGLGAGADASETPAEPGPIAASARLSLRSARPAVVSVVAGAV